MTGRTLSKLLGRERDGYRGGVNGQENGLSSRSLVMP